MGKRGNQDKSRQKRRAAKQARAESRKKRNAAQRKRQDSIPDEGMSEMTPLWRHGDVDEPEASVLTKHGNYTVLATGDSEEEAQWIAGGVQEIGGAKILKPHKALELEYRDEASANFLSILSPGEYTDAELISDALNKQAVFLGELLDEVLGRCGHEMTIEFLLYQHDQWSIALEWAKQSASELGDDTLEREKAEWILEKHAQNRRALKTVIERAVSLYDGEKSYEDENQDSEEAYERWVMCVGRALLLAQELVGMFMLSDSTYRLFPTTTLLEVSDPDEEEVYFSLHSEAGESLIAEARARTEHWHEVANGRGLSVTDADLDILNELDRPFAEELGFTVTDALSVLAQLSLAEGDKPSFLLHAFLSDVVSALAENLEMDAPVVEKIVRGWSMREDNVDWRPHKPKRTVRILTRPLVTLEGYGDEPLLIASREMAAEAAMAAVDLWVRRGHQQLPTEWSASEDGSAVEALNRYAHKRDAALEQLTSSALSELGFKGMRVGVNTLRPRGLVIPSEVGEIDYVGALPQKRTLLVVENKNINPAVDPAGFTAERDEFRNEYIPQLERKYSWVAENAADVLRALGEEFDFHVDSGEWKVVPVLVTDREHAVVALLADIHISSLALLVDELEHGALESISWEHQLVEI